ncbi:MAG: hypothetical protein BWY82_01362 [Verrucomicrobia bacterium ADurb.Bin474]|nr:MAG: hypothetical protein BWY82_01362 [Verrucomicrobia bacterium ADurb.Bin474]
MIPYMHPGEYLSEILTEMGISPQDLASKSGIPESLIMDILHQKARITLDDSARIGRFIGQSESLWFGMYQAYEKRMSLHLANPKAYTGDPDN